jgi:hypothetical protein
VTFAVLPERDTDGSIVRGGRVDVSALQVGDCFDWTTDISTGSIRQVDLLPCVDSPDAMHVADVVYSATTTAAWPGVSSLESFTQTECARHLTAEMMLVNIMPTEATWADGDRTIACIGV